MSFAWSWICGWVVDGENFTSVRIEDGDEITRVCVQIVVGAQSREDEALL